MFGIEETEYLYITTKTVTTQEALVVIKEKVIDDVVSLVKENQENQEKQENQENNLTTLFGHIFYLNPCRVEKHSSANSFRIWVRIKL